MRVREPRPLTLRRLALGLSALLALACGAAQSSGPSERCVGGSDTARAECEARACYYGPQSWCAGVAPPEAWEERATRGELDCACTCPADVERCSTLP